GQPGISPRRSTPTRVGNTEFSGFPKFISTVHPHACGEYAAANLPAKGGVGPPPRVWGIRPASTARLFPLRSTPTRVGNTFRLTPMRSAASVHPHACGEYCL